ncbi:guanylate kinase [Coxiella endosymbiont of Amblyomma sculptum]|uniref:guanylate kinase n=1 Tax=Coxiella endosymbiont of Amblyomma sculptum TaxID=2487929 RepID=UPI00132ED5BF|nr:guanylate kinase [Coxiella endosymbiont of Amblyomma sculptum]QHG92473.1 guanylate kinase [Coxiella endosymbiont of Amblyomma sculptum]
MLVGHTRKSNLFVVSAPSGTGKTSLVRAVADELDDIKIAVSYTTRPPREEDRMGIDYFFIDDNQFRDMIQKNAFLEHATIYNYCYGTSKEWVIEQLRSEKDVLLEIDWQGARQIRTLFPFGITVFVLPPSVRTLRERLVKRSQGKSDTVEERLAVVREEMAHYTEYDYLVVNDDFNRAIRSLLCIVSAARLQQNIQRKKLTRLLESLLRS